MIKTKTRTDGLIRTYSDESKMIKKLVQKKLIVKQ